MKRYKLIIMMISLPFAYQSAYAVPRYDAQHNDVYYSSTRTTAHFSSAATRASGQDRWRERAYYHTRSNYVAETQARRSGGFFSFFGGHHSAQYQDVNRFSNSAEYADNYADAQDMAAAATSRTGQPNSFVFDPNQHRWFAYSASGSLVRSGPASGGQNYCADIGRSCRTPVGSFRLYSKGGAGCNSL